MCFKPTEITIFGGYGSAEMLKQVSIFDIKTQEFRFSHDQDYEIAFSNPNMTSVRVSDKLAYAMGLGNKNCYRAFVLERNSADGIAAYHEISLLSEAVGSSMGPLPDYDINLVLI